MVETTAYQRKYLDLEPEDFLYTGAAPWAKTARETKLNFLSDQVNKIFGAAAGEAKRLGLEEERRYHEGLSRVKGAYEKSLVPTISDETERMLEAQASDVASRDFKRDIGQIRNFLGGAGVTGGGIAAGLGSQARIARLGKISDARTQLRIDKAREDAADRQRALLGAERVSAFEGQDPSTAWVQFLTNALLFRGGQQAAAAQEYAAKKSASASNSAGIFGAIGDIVGSAFSFLG